MKTSKGSSFKKPSWFIYWCYPFCISTSHDLENMKQQNFDTTQMTLKGVLLKIGVSPNHWLPQCWKVRFGRLKLKLWPLVSPILWWFPDSKWWFLEGYPLMSFHVWNISDHLASFVIIYHQLVIIYHNQIMFGLYNPKVYDNCCLWWWWWSSSCFSSLGHWAMASDSVSRSCHSHGQPQAEMGIQWEYDGNMMDS